MAMKTITWKEGLTLPHDPNDVEDYKLNLAGWLDSATISGTPTATAEAGIIATYIEGAGLTYVGFRVSGGTAGNTYGVTIHAEQASGTAIDHTIKFAVRAR